MKRLSPRTFATSTRLTLYALVLVGLPVFWLLFSQFGAEFIFVLVPLAVIAGLAYRIHTKRLEQKTREISEASRIHLATVEALATAIDARDQVGKGHVRRTQIYAVGIGRLLGLSDGDIDALRTGALLHDIGKLAVPDHILNKPGSLTPAELEKTKIHPSVGAAILERVGFKTPVVPTVKFHHEAWDGSGYPDGLMAEQIPLTARILSVADAFDTLLGARPYRPAMSRDDARKIMQAEAGSRFDPTIVKTLLRNLGLLEAEIDAQGLSYESLDSPDGAREDQNYVEQIKLANREVFSLYELAREFSTSVSLHETVDMFARKIGEFVPFDTFGLYLLDESKRSASAVHVEGANSELLISRRITIGQGATGFALKTRETVHNVDPDLDFAYSQSELAGQYSTMASVPLIADDKLIGAATVYSCELSNYGEENIRLLETISRIAANAIGKSLSHD
ncbi:MAG: HD domain-containing phosphohydrolase, partial [Pyrinomonadaceae bacterium]